MYNTQTSPTSDSEYIKLLESQLDENIKAREVLISNLKDIQQENDIYRLNEVENQNQIELLENSYKQLKHKFNVELQMVLQDQNFTSDLISKNLQKEINNLQSIEEQHEKLIYFLETKFSCSEPQQIELFVSELIQKNQSDLIDITEKTKTGLINAKKQCMELRKQISDLTTIQVSPNINILGELGLVRRYSDQHIQIKHRICEIMNIEQLSNWDEILLQLQQKISSYQYQQISAHQSMTASQHQSAYSQKENGQLVQKIQQLVDINMFLSKRCIPPTEEVFRDLPRMPYPAQINQKLRQLNEDLNHKINKLIRQSQTYDEPKTQPIYTHFIELVYVLGSLLTQKEIVAYQKQVESCLM